MPGRSPTRQSSAEQVEALRVRAAIDQVLALADDAMRAHAGNRALVDLALDVRNALQPPRSR